MKLTRVTKVDYEYLYNLLKLRPKESNISHRDMPTYADHVSYWNGIIKSVGWDAYMVTDGIWRVGYVYLTDRDEIGIHIHPDYQRCGLARAAIAELMRLHPRKRYLANVAPGNQASHELFKALGFSPIQLTYCLENVQTSNGSEDRKKS